MIMEIFPIHTYGTYILTSSSYSIDTHLDLLSIPQSGVLAHTRVALATDETAISSQ